MKKKKLISIINLSNTKLITRIIISFIIVLVLSMATVGFLIFELRRTNKMMDDMYNTFNVSNNSLEAEINIHIFEGILQNYVQAMQEKNIDRAYQIISADAVALDSSLGSNLETIKTWIRDEKGKKLLADVETLFKKWRENVEELTNHVKQEDYPGAFQTASMVKGNLKEYKDKLTELNFQAGQVAADFHDKSEKNLSRVFFISLIVSAALLVISVLIAVFISKNISRSVSFFKETFSEGASGDLNASYPANEHSRDEINEMGIMFNQFMQRVREVIREVVDVAGELGVSSEQLSVTISSFSENSQSQAASMEEITATMEEISAGIDNVSENSQYQYEKLNDFISVMQELSGIINSMANRISEAQGLSKNISGLANAGNESLNKMDDIMSEITESSNKVSDIVGIINDISDKINLLSLNAAIEAARAGEAGRGFAVVADEISKLADQTATSIKDIGLLIKKNEDDIDLGMKNVVNTVDNISQIIEGVESIYSMMNKIFTTMEEQQKTNATMNTSADVLKERSDEVRTASEEQRNAVAEIMKSITNINDLVQTSAAGSEEMTANSGKLASMAENLKNKVSFFKF